MFEERDGIETPTILLFLPPPIRLRGKGIFEGFKSLQVAIFHCDIGSNLFLLRGSRGHHLAVHEHEKELFHPPSKVAFHGIIFRRQEDSLFKGAHVLVIRGQQALVQIIDIVAVKEIQESLNLPARNKVVRFVRTDTERTTGKVAPL